MKVAAIPLVAVLAASFSLVGHADAQVRVRGGVRVVTPRTSVGVFVGRPYYYRPIYRSFYRPLYFDPFFSPYYYRPFYWYPYAAVGYGYGRFDGEGSLRVQVMPRDTEIYIDNYYAGTSDDFDGMFQRLHIEPGAHDITLFREGYRTVQQRIYIQSTGTFRLRYNMMPLGPGEAPEPRPAEPPPPPGAQGGAPPRGAYPAPPPPPAPGQAQSTSLSIRVQPMNAEVFIDGERWESSGEDRLVVQVAPGTHHVEVRRDGYRTYATDINVRPGETSTVNISLTRQ
ncbi:MAG TPA: PEGA domain-containing protein [Vicinamibacterales bacterium]|nr:PEGA domain-containing protein [Vicinamibacterales bacterium]